MVKVDVHLVYTYLKHPWAGETATTDTINITLGINLQESDKLRIERHYLWISWFKELAHKIAEGIPQDRFPTHRDNPPTPASCADTDTPFVPVPYIQRSPLSPLDTQRFLWTSLVVAHSFAIITEIAYCPGHRIITSAMNRKASVIDSICENEYHRIYLHRVMTDCGADVCLPISVSSCGSITDSKCWWVAYGRWCWTASVCMTGGSITKWLIKWSLRPKLALCRWWIWILGLRTGAGVKCRNGRSLGCAWRNITAV